MELQLILNVMVYQIILKILLVKYESAVIILSKA